MQNKFGFILVNPQLGENIGSCARAMKNFGFSNLNIISPRDGWPNTKARMTSVGAFDIIKSAKIYKNVNEAVKKFDLVFSASARNRDINKKYISITNFTKLLSKYKSSNIGIMFGPEASGLSNYDLSLSNFIIQVPTSDKLKSLNYSRIFVESGLTFLNFLIKNKFINNIYLFKTNKNLNNLGINFSSPALIKRLILKNKINVNLDTDTLYKVNLI